MTAARAEGRTPSPARRQRPSGRWPRRGPRRGSGTRARGCSRPGGHLVRPDRDRPFETAPVPGLQCSSCAASATRTSGAPVASTSTVPPAIAPSFSGERVIEVVDEPRTVNSLQGVGVSRRSASVSPRRTRWHTARVASAEVSLSSWAGAVAHSSGPASPVTAARSRRSKKWSQPSRWLTSCSGVRPSCQSDEGAPRWARGSARPWRCPGPGRPTLPAPAEHITRRPGTTSRKEPEATWPGTTVQR